MSTGTLRAVLLLAAPFFAGCKTGLPASQAEHWSVESVPARMVKHFTGYRADRDGAFVDYQYQKKKHINRTLRRHFANNSANSPIDLSVQRRMSLSRCMRTCSNSIARSSSASFSDSRCCAREVSSETMIDNSATAADPSAISVPTSSVKGRSGIDAPKNIFKPMPVPVKTGMDAGSRRENATGQVPGAPIRSDRIGAPVTCLVAFS